MYDGQLTMVVDFVQAKSMQYINYRKRVAFSSQIVHCQLFIVNQTNSDLQNNKEAATN